MYDQRLCQAKDLCILSKWKLENKMAWNELFSTEKSYFQHVVFVSSEYEIKQAVYQIKHFLFTVAKK